MNTSAFEKELTSVLDRHTDVLKECDPLFLQNYVHHCLSTDNIVSPRKFKISKGFSFFSYKTIKDIFIKTILIFLLLTGCLILMKDTISSKIAHMEENDVETFNQYLFLYRKWIVYFGLQDLVFLRKLNAKSCLIPNPLYKEDKSDCKCGHVLKKYKLLDLDESKKNFKQEGMNTPYIVLNAVDYPISFNDIKSYVMDRIDAFSEARGMVTTVNGPSVGRDFNNIFTDDVPPRYSIVYWEFDNVNGARYTRPLFSRPKFVPQENEISLERRILFYGENSSSSIVPLDYDNTGTGMVYYLQAWGSRKFALLPHKKCKCKKESILTFALQPGQIVVYHPMSLRLFSSSIKDSASYSIGYIGSVH